MQNGGKLPAKVTRIANTGIHAIAAGWDILVRGVAGEKYPVEAVALGDQQVRRPGTCEQDFVVELASGEVAKHCAGINRLRRDVLRKSRLKRPDVPIILRDQRALGGLVVPRHAEMLEHVMGRGAKVDQKPVHHSRLTVQSDAETIPHLTAAPVAADKVLAAQLLF